MILLHELMNNVVPLTTMKVIHRKAKRVLFDSRISGDVPPDLMMYWVESITVENNILTIYVFC